MLTIARASPPAHGVPFRSSTSRGILPPSNRERNRHAHGIGIEQASIAFQPAPQVGQPSISRWVGNSRAAGNAEPLVTYFPKPLDYALLQHEIEVTGVTAKVSVERDKTEWRFIPDSPWRAGTYAIVIRTTLEDLAGNHINRAFDVDTFDPITHTSLPTP